MIDLKPYLTPPVRQLISELYQLHQWPFEPPDAWIWKYPEVCALYFRVERHADVFAGEAQRGRHVLAGIRTAIDDYLRDEFA